jgi:hypothetical protein
MAKLRVTRLKKYKNGSATVEITIDKDYTEAIKTVLNKKEITRKRVQKFIRESLINYVNEHSLNENYPDLERGIK